MGGSTGGGVVRCNRCHRVLKDERAREIGFGRVCWAKATANRSPERAAAAGRQRRERSGL